MILEGLRTISGVKLLFDTSHLHKFQYCDDSHLHDFCSKWTATFQLMRPEDSPWDNFLIDILYSKSDRKSSCMAIVLSRSDSAGEGDPERTSEHLQLAEDDAQADQEGSRKTTLA